MLARTIDLAAHINQTVERGHPADFPVTLKPVYHYANEGRSLKEIPRRTAIVREDTGESLAVVSDRYTLVRHQDLLSAVAVATERLDVGPVPRGIFVDRRGARMRALFKFPALAEPILGTDTICPCIKIQNTYDGMSRVTAHIGAFRFVCTNLAVGGGGIFAGGFMAVHVGEIRIEDLSAQLRSYLSDFRIIVQTYRRWTDQEFDHEGRAEILTAFPKRAARAIEDGLSGALTVYAAYNVATNYATHRMRSPRAAFELLERVNRTFQEHFQPKCAW